MDEENFIERTGKMKKYTILAAESVDVGGIL